MGRLVVWLDADPLLPAAIVGGKAASLSDLLRAGFAVPPGICLTVSAFELALQPFQAAILACLSEPETAAAHIAHLLTGLSLPEEVRRSLFELLPRLGTPEVGFAVRSSAVHEDGAQASFAGQYATLLGVKSAQEIETAVLDCYRSYFSLHALAARAAAGVENGLQGMAVLIQPIIDAECAGVCFSVDPVSHKRERIVVNSAWGLGAGVADGSVPNDTDWLYRDGFSVERRHIVEKDKQIKLDDSGRPHVTSVPEEFRRAACLPETWLKRVAHFAIALENHFGTPQDVEWAVSGEKLWILQSRPITALPSDLHHIPPFPVEWQGNEGRVAWMPSYFRSLENDLLLPLEYAQLELLESIREEACLFLGVERNEVLKKVNGRPYQRPIPLKLTAADKRIRSQAQEDQRDRLFDAGVSLWDIWGPEVERTTERLRAFAMSAAGAQELAEHLEEAMAAQRRHDFIHPLCIWRPRKAYFAAYTAVSGRSGPEAEHAATQLLEGEETPLTRLIDSLYELAVGAREHPVLAQLLTNPLPAVDAYLEALAQDEWVIKFRQRLDSILDTYGERNGHGYGSHNSLYTPTWRERPAALLRQAAPYLDPRLDAPAQSRARAQQKRNEEVDALCAACDDAQAVAEFRRLLANGRHWWTVLELHNHYIDQMANGQLHHAVMGCARWLNRQGLLTHTDDIFWLTFAEILDALRAADTADLEPILHQRRAQYKAWEQLIPPPILGIPDPQLGEREPPGDEVTDLENDPQIIQGIGAAPGQVTGRARIMPGASKLPDLLPGDILVAHNVGPLWTPIFPMLGGLVLDTGSVGQHAAATAREYGLTAVVGTVDASKRIPDGAVIFVDGYDGIVKIMP